MVKILAVAATVLAGGPPAGIEVKLLINNPVWFQIAWFMNLDNGGKRSEKFEMIWTHDENGRWLRRIFEW